MCLSVEFRFTLNVTLRVCCCPLANSSRSTCEATGPTWRMLVVSARRERLALTNRERLYPRPARPPVAFRSKSE